jgi:uncharacterized membrane protein (DUF485 family)
MPLNASLEQKGKLGYTKEISIRDGQEIQVRQLAGKYNKSYRLHLLALASKGKAKIHIAWPWLWTTILSATVLVVYIATRQLLPFEDSFIELAIYLACAVGIILGLVMAILKLSLKRVYTSRIAKVPILEFDINKPDRKSYKTFVDELEEHIKKMHATYPLKADQQLAGEIRTLRRLLQDGVVSQAAYNSAKAKILKN